jgi:DNA sulfur modification protein DndB
MLEVRIPAMRGKMGHRTYYSCVMPMSAVPQFFKFTNWAGISPEDREQRVLNEKRVPDLSPAARRRANHQRRAAPLCGDC